MHAALPMTGKENEGRTMLTGVCWAKVEAPIADLYSGNGWRLWN